MGLFSECAKGLYGYDLYCSLKCGHYVNVEPCNICDGTCDNGCKLNSRGQNVMVCTVYCCIFMTFKREAGPFHHTLIKQMFIGLF